MSTPVVRMDCDPEHRDKVARHFRDDVMPWAVSRAGFTNGTWSIAPDSPWRITSVDVFERVASAPQEDRHRA